jgi:DNA-binding beta-propeller fold protein YncE
MRLVTTRVLGLASVVAVAASCGEPIVVLGDIPGTMRIVAGIPNMSGESANQLATESAIDNPSGLAIGDDGRVFVSDQRNARLLSVASNGTMQVIRADRFCTGTCIEGPADAALDADGRLIVADSGSNRLWRFDLGAGAAEVLAGNGVQGVSPDGTLATEARLERPRGVAVDVDGTIYFTEIGAHRVRFIDAAGNLQTLAGTGVPGFSGDGGSAADAQLDSPAGLDIAVDVLYIADAANHRVRAMNLGTGTIETVAGTGLQSFAGDGGPAVDASLNRPRDVAATPDGRRIFIADTGNHRVRHVPLDTGLIETFAGTGDVTFNGDLLDAGATSIDSPSGLTAGPFGFLFISDPGHDVVWRVVLGF